MESIIDQLRIHDGKLFQNELVLSVYVDFKRLVLNHILLALSTPGGLKTFLDWDEDLEAMLVSNLLVTDCLFSECLQVFCDELQRNPKINDLRIMLKSMFAKLCSDSFVVSKQILALDPIKQDFIMREIFRRCLFELTEAKSSKDATQSSLEPLLQSLQGMPQGPQGPQDLHGERSQEPFGPLGTLGPLGSSDESQTLPDTISVVQEKHDAKVEQVKHDAIEQARASVAPSVTSVASTMTHKKPLVRKVVLDDDASTIFTASRR